MHRWQFLRFSPPLSLFGSSVVFLRAIALVIFNVLVCLTSLRDSGLHVIPSRIFCGNKLAVLRRKIEFTLDAFLSRASAL